MRAQQTAESEMARLRQIAHQRELARQQQMMTAQGRPGWGQPAPGAWGQQPAQGWVQVGRDGGMKAPERPRHQQAR
jgi:hypothetical protein